MSSNVAPSITDTSLSSASYQRSHCERHLGKIITAIALAAIALLMSGGLLYHFHVLNLLSSCCLMGAGALLIVTAGIVASMQAYQFSEKMRGISEKLKGKAGPVDPKELIHYLEFMDEETFSSAMSYTTNQCQTLFEQKRKLAPWKEVFYEICSLMAAKNEKKFTSCLSGEWTYRQFVLSVYNLYMITKEEIESWVLEPTRLWIPTLTQLQIFKLIVTNKYFFSIEHQNMRGSDYWVRQYYLFTCNLLFLDLNSLRQVLCDMSQLNREAFKEVFTYIFISYLGFEGIISQDEGKAIYWIERLKMVVDIINDCHLAAIQHNNGEEDFLSDSRLSISGVHARFGMCLIHAYARSLNIAQLAEKRAYFETMIRRYYPLFQESVEWILPELDQLTQEAFYALGLEIPSHAENLSEDENFQ